MKLLWPLQGHEENSLSQGFGGTSLNYAPQVGHNGLDFPASYGVPIRACHDGDVVERATKDTGFGKRVSIKFFDNGRWWLAVSAHMENFAKPNEFDYDWYHKETVKKGEIIGYVGSTGFSTGSHLHFGIYPMYENGEKVLLNNGYGGGTDPLPYLKGDTMVYFAHREGTSEYGFTVEDAWEVCFKRATSEQEIKFQAAKYGINVSKPDGSIDFSRAKDVKF